MVFKNQDISIFYEVYGDHPKSVVILPGWGDTRKTFRYIISYLSNFFTVYVIDYPGFGESPFPNRNLTIFDYADSIHQFLKENNIQNSILIGHSFGGRIIITLAGYYQYSYSNIILMDSAGIKPPVTIRTYFRKMSYQLLMKFSRLLPKKWKKNYRKKIFSLFASDDYRNLTTNMRETFKNIVNYDLSDYLKNIRSRVLLIWGNQDTATPIRDARIMNRSIADSELIILDKVGHFPYLERPDLINRIIFEQLKEEIH
ncbi:MAG: alpha/beta hydrolase [bacterium]|nr:alpha/beta hydrolase [bacterium]